MKTLGTPKGLVLIFDSIDDLQAVIDHLSGMLEWVVLEEVSSPYLYSMFDDRIDKAEIEELLDELKKDYE